MNLILFAQSTPSPTVVDVGKEVSDKVVGVGQQTWDNLVTQFTNLASGYAPKALAVLIIGWIVALGIGAVVRAAVTRLRLDRWLSESVTGADVPDVAELGRKIGKGVYYLIMLLVLVAFFQTLGLTSVADPLSQFLNKIFEYAPQLIAAGVLLFAAWVVAGVLRFVVRRVLTAAEIDQRLTREAGVEGDQDLPLTKTISEATYWLVYLLFLPAVLDALNVPGLLAPVQDMVTRILGFLPNLFAAGVILGIGWIVARIVQRVVSNLLAATGADRLSDRVGLARIMGENKLSGVLGLSVYILILVPVIVGSLNALQIEAVTRPASDMLNSILGTLPGIFAAVLVVGVAWVVGRVVSGMATHMLTGIGFDRLPARLGLATEPAEGRRTPSQIVGTIVMVAIVLFAAMQALPMLGFDLLATMMSDFLTFASRVLVALVIFGFGLFAAKLVADMIADSGIPNAKLLSVTARAAILVLAGAMGLQQTGVAQEIVNLAFGITVGAIAVAAAIAFGIGARDAAKNIVDGFVADRLPRPERRIEPSPRRERAAV